MKKVLKIKINNKELFRIFIVGVVLLTLFLFSIFNEVISPKLEKVAELEFEKIVDSIASNYGIINDFQIPFDNLLTIVKNDKGEILTVDYQMSQIYAITHMLSLHLEEDMNNISKKLSNDYKNYDVKKEGNALLLDMPMGMVSDYVFLNNLGPKIPVLMRFIDTVYTNIKTKLTNYGINNCLVEVYLEVTLKYELITPVSDREKRLDYSVMLHSKIIQGTVPDWYSGEYISKSKEVNESI